MYFEILLLDPKVEFTLAQVELNLAHWTLITA